jgi:hypothetical protein
LKQQPDPGYRDIAQPALVMPMNPAGLLPAPAAPRGRCPDTPGQHNNAVALLNSVDRQTRQVRQ